MSGHFTMGKMYCGKISEQRLEKIEDRTPVLRVPGHKALCQGTPRTAKTARENEKLDR